MTKSAGERKSNSDVARDRAASRDGWPAIVLIVLLQGSLFVADPERPASGWTMVWSLLPLAPTLWLAWGQVKALRRADELQRVLQLESMAIGFGTAMVLAFAGGLLDAAGRGDPRQSLQITGIAGVIAWATALLVKTRRAA